jgi:hypothetical protein
MAFSVLMSQDIVADYAPYFFRGISLPWYNDGYMDTD